VLNDIPFLSVPTLSQIVDAQCDARSRCLQSQWCATIYSSRLAFSASEMTYIVSSGALNSTLSLTHPAYVTHADPLTQSTRKCQTPNAVDNSPEITSW